MPESKRRKPRPQGGFVPPSQRKHGSLNDMQARRVVPDQVHNERRHEFNTPEQVLRPFDKPAPVKQITRAATRSGITRTHVAVGGGAIAAAGGTGYLVHRHNQRKHAMSKNLVNPFEEVVVFGKAYPVALPVPGARTVRALVPTGRHVGHANDLKVVRRSGSGGRSTKLEIYRHSPRGLRQGPFGKGAGFMDAGKYKRSERFLTSAIFGRNSDKVVTASGSAARKNRAQVQNGLALVNNPKVGNVSRVAPQRFSAPTPKINSNIPDGARRGNKLS